MAYVTATATATRICAVLAAAVACAAAAALPLPSYIKPCKINDPGLNECSLKNGREAIPSILKGDPKYRVPSMEPLVISEVSVADRGLNITLRNVRLHGIADIEFRSSVFDPKGKKFEWGFFLPRLQVLADYQVDGKILVLPLKGSGPANITLLDVPLTLKFEYELVKKEDGKEYLNPTKATPTFDTSRTYIQLDNLFNGDKLLGENTNMFLNENWREVTTDVGPVIAQAIAEAVRQILSGIALQVPYGQLFIQ
ncbi:circadian clock-controlled protein daywake-like [Schistocerca cancellata]|uniref:circadian clock-controlled protein daywake-like n=1 Tax=Schistocerca cancellata TaxID=274614 RepID=UPI002118A1DA|nr:circadian clock-controlled protein daywake-like [Schistocerca cancellata]